MNEADLNDRLSRISTMWTVLRQAHASPAAEAEQALVAIVERYQGAAYRYLLAATRDPDAADELFQEFALRLARGAFRHFDPARGRFRDYVKSALCHLAVDYQRRRQKATPVADLNEVAAAAVPNMAASDDEFLASWREEMLNKAWTALRDQEGRGGQPFYRVLKYRSEHPEATSAEMAAALGEQLRPAQPFTETGIRKTLQRARAQFAELLIKEVARSLGQPTAEDLEQELIDLSLWPYCRSALSRWRAAEPP